MSLFNGPRRHVHRALEWASRVSEMASEDVSADLFMNPHITSPLSQIIQGSALWWI